MKIGWPDNYYSPAPESRQNLQIGFSDGRCGRFYSFYFSEIEQLRSPLDKKQIQEIIDCFPAKNQGEMCKWISLKLIEESDIGITQVFLMINVIESGFEVWKNSSRIEI